MEDAASARVRAELLTSVASRQALILNSIRPILDGVRACVMTEPMYTSASPALRECILKNLEVDLLKWAVHEWESKRDPDAVASAVAELPPLPAAAAALAQDDVWIMPPPAVASAATDAAAVVVASIVIQDEKEEDEYEEEFAEDAHDGDRQRCVFCPVAKRDRPLVMLYPCRHICMCGECAAVMMAADRKCPTCNKVVSEIIYPKPT